jgi:lipoyl(octanoyl) transferase
MEWKISKKPVLYPDAVAQMEARVEDIIAGKAGDMVWLLEHPPIFTSGTSAKPEDLINAQNFPVFETGRGGQFTYHGPGQRVGYVMMQLHHQDIRKHIYNLEQWIIDTLAEFDIQGERRADRIGIWVQDKKHGEAKIAAIGVRVKKWVAYHGIAINVNPNLEHFNGIVPCGIREFGVTSLWAMGKKIEMQDLDKKLKSTFKKIFG